MSAWTTCDRLHLSDKWPLPANPAASILPQRSLSSTSLMVLVIPIWTFTRRLGIKWRRKSGAVGWDSMSRACPLLDQPKTKIGTVWFTWSTTKRAPLASQYRRTRSIWISVLSYLSILKSKPSLWVTLRRKIDGKNIDFDRKKGEIGWKFCWMANKWIRKVNKYRGK